MVRMTVLATTLTERIVPVLKQTLVTKAYLFGSIARGEANEESDVDVLVEAPVKGFSLLDLAGLIADLTEVCGRKVDVVLADSISKYIRPYVEREKVLFYER